MLRLINQQKKPKWTMLCIKGHSQGIPLSVPILMVKEVEMNKNLDGDPNFRASISLISLNIAIAFRN